MSGKKQHFPINLGDNGQATLFRGFAKQIQVLQLPRLHVVQKIGRDIGLVIMTQANFDKLNIREDEDPIQTIRLIIASQMSIEEKLAKVTELVENERLL